METILVETTTKIYKIVFGPPSDWPGADQDFIVFEHPGKVIAVAQQAGDLIAWFEANTAEEKINRHFRIIGTGWHRPPAQYTHLGSLMIGPFAVHLYEL